MFKSKTLFIVGAGASQEVSLPTGGELRTKIAKAIDLRFQDGRLASGDRTIAEALRRHIEDSNTSHNEMTLFVQAGQMIRNAMPLAISIDNFMDAHRDDANIALCGKLAIVRAILAAERASKLFVDNSRSRGIKFESITNTWYSAFFRLATESIAKKDIVDAFSNVSFITFNYDRCIEHFLAESLCNYYGLMPHESHEVVARITIMHPYGVVGHLPWQKGVSLVPFGGRDDSAEDLLAIASQVKTFTEQVEDKLVLSRLRALVRDADTIVFLGFAFHPQNMTLLAPEEPSKAKRIFATAKGISDSDAAVVSGEIVDWLKRDSRRTHVSLRNTLSAAQLFDEYWRSLTQG